MKIELKHLAPYLPYKLKGNVSDHEENEHWINEELTHICLDDLVLSFRDATDVYLDEPNETTFKPILKPLSDLTKEIDNIGFTYYDELKNLYGGFELHHTCKVFYPNLQEWLSFIDVINFTNKLFEWHFDVFGLIENNLAIDINTI